MKRDELNKSLADDGLPEVEEIRSLTLKPGDVLVVRISDRRLSREAAHRLKERISSLFPRNEILIVDQGVVFEPYTPAAANEAV